MNTGRLIYKRLIEVDVETGLPTGNSKANVEGDPDYVAPLQVALGNCPIQYNQFGSGIVFITTANSIDLTTIVNSISNVELIVWGDGTVTENDVTNHSYQQEGNKIVMIQTVRGEVQMTQTSDILQVIYKSSNVWLT